jgi:predicted amidohydrolase YtcJ
MHLRAAALLSLLLAVPGARAADLVLHDGAVYTLNDKQPWTSAVVIHDGRIAYVGDEAGLKPYLSGAHVIDLHGAMVLPGFHDAHIHPMSGAMRLLQCNLSDAKTLQDVEKAVKADAAAMPAHPWVFCNGVPEALGAKLTRQMLDAWSPDKPAFVRTASGFTAWANSKALAAGGLDPKDTALLKGDVTSLVRNQVPVPSEGEYREALRRASVMANRAGITSVFDAAAEPDMLTAYHHADQADELTLRVVAAQRIDPDLGVKQVNDFIQRRDAVQGHRFRADAAKIFMDGEISEHTAAMLAPYADAPDSRGLVYDPYQITAIDDIVKRLDATGFLIHFHAMGDAAVRAALDALEKAEQADGAQDRRDQIAHDGVVDPADIPRFGKLGVTANFSSIWFQAGDPPSAPTLAALGPERTKWMFPIASIAKAGGRLTGGSDWPQLSMAPLDYIQYAVTRQPLDGSKPPLQPEQRITLAQAILAYTKDAAWAVREDKLDGTLEVGKAADIVVLDQNLFKIDVMSIHNTHVLLTLLDGAPVYRDPAFVWPQ